MHTGNLIILAIAIFFSSTVSSAEEAKTPEVQDSNINLETIRSLLEKKGVGKQFLFMENLNEKNSNQEDASSQTEPSRRLVFWTRTGARTQAIVIAPLPSSSGTNFVRIQSTGLAFLKNNHPRFGEIAAYMLDRNFVMNGSLFARDKFDGEIVLRADLAISKEIDPARFMKTLEAVLSAAERESSRLANLIGLDAQVNVWPKTKDTITPSQWIFASTQSNRKVKDKRVAR